MRLVLLEDEPPAMAQLRAAVVAARPDARVEAELATLAAARAWFSTHPTPDLVISDIILADGNALALFREGRVRCPVVFATAHDAYLLEAFRCAAIDYLLKPIDPHAVARALDKHRDLRTLLAPQSAEAIAEASAAEPHARGARRRILARLGTELRAVGVDEVAYFLADDKLTVLVTTDGHELLVDRSLSALGLELDPTTFFRTNRASLVNVRSVRSFRSLGKGRLEVKLSPARVVCVSQENGAAFKAWMGR